MTVYETKISTYAILLDQRMKTCSFVSTKRGHSKLTTLFFKLKNKKKRWFWLYTSEQLCISNIQKAVKKKQKHTKKIGHVFLFTRRSELQQRRRENITDFFMCFIFHEKVFCTLVTLTDVVNEKMAGFLFFFVVSSLLNVILLFQL